MLAINIKKDKKEKKGRKTKQKTFRNVEEI